MRTLVLILVSLLSIRPCQADGGTEQASKSPFGQTAYCDPNIPGDVSSDCRVDFNDFAIMASNWLGFEELIQLWVARYNGPGNERDMPCAIATDSNDNIYVTGYSVGSGTDRDYATIKYGPDSNEPIWVARYNGPDNSVDQAYAIAIDSNDNIYVTGHSYGPGPDRDYATIKYGPDSNEPIWVARYDGPANSGDTAIAVAIDSNDNIYVTGYSGGSYSDYATVKYGPDSNEPIWVARYNGPANVGDEAHDIAIDSDDNIYVTGYSDRSGADRDYTTIKYGPDSNEPIWLARYNGPGNYEDVARAIAIDSNSNIYVAGHSVGSGPWYDYATIKYGPDSNEPIWVARYNGPGNHKDAAADIAIDSNDNIYVTGHSAGSGPSFDYATIKYGPDSNEPIWVARYNGPADRGDIATAVAIDSDDNIYVTGYSSGFGIGYDYTTIKYGPDSNEPIWVARYNGPGNYKDAAADIAIDSNDNIYVTGYSDGSGTERDYATVKYARGYTCAIEIPGDYDQDCIVDFADLEIIIDHWLECNLEPPDACFE
ncbi:MAG: SBBP repeat-containing protein [Planctomycetota bacterium]